MILKVSLAIIAFMIGSQGARNNKIPDGLGITNGRLAPLSSKPNSVSSQTEGEKFVEPLKFKGTLDKTKRTILEILEEETRVKIITNDKYYIHAIFTTGTMKYKDDVEFYFDNKKKLIHFRSASRIGYSDMGLNRKRYEELSTKYYNK